MFGELASPRGEAPLPQSDPVKARRASSLSLGPLPLGMVKDMAQVRGCILGPFCDRPEDALWELGYFPSPGGHPWSGWM